MIIREGTFFFNRGKWAGEKGLTPPFKLLPSLDATPYLIYHGLYVIPRA